MTEWFAAVVSIPVSLLFLTSLVPSRIADANARWIRSCVTAVLGIQAIAALLLSITFVMSGGLPVTATYLEVDRAAGVQLGLHFDGVSSLMLVMVSIVGFVVSRFSVRYLDGEAMQGRYFRWLGFTTAAVTTMVLASNLVLFFCAWVMTSFGLHQLLLHYRHREAAHRAAWTKFAISRIGDTFLIIALVLVFKCFGTFDLAAIFEMVGTLTEQSKLTSAHAAISWFIVMGAVAKSAQFPFHTWLPDTMETPTPVSALMHAGIVNAGGYLIIRTSPLVAIAPEALAALAALGAFTACFAGIVMMTQTSVKRGLAYSTIAQMGFMMLQCGLGAFSAAMLHILAHSFYKAHAFLSSGSVIAERNGLRGARTPNWNGGQPKLLLLAAGVVFVSLLTVSWLFAVDFTSKNGGVVLAFALWLALTTWGWRLFALRDRRAGFVGVLGILMLSIAYLGSYSVIHSLIAPSVPEVLISDMARFVSLDICLLFCVLFMLHILLLQRMRPAWLEPLRIHAANGFYVDTIYRRVFGGLDKA